MEHRVVILPDAERDVEALAPEMREAILRLEEDGLVHAEGILDAGCGPLTLERYLDQSVHGIDMNPHMIELARTHSPWQGKNARVGYLSELPEEWTGKFELTVASLVLHWTSLRHVRGTLPDRMRILQQLVRITHPHGYVWLTFPLSVMTQPVLARWVRAFSRMGFVIIKELTGLVRARDVVARKRPFMFWSIYFSPNDSPCEVFK